MYLYFIRYALKSIEVSDLSPLSSVSTLQFDDLLCAIREQGRIENNYFINSEVNNDHTDQTTERNEPFLCSIRNGKEQSLETTSSTQNRKHRYGPEYISYPDMFHDVDGGGDWGKSDKMSVMPPASVGALLLPSERDGGVSFDELAHENEVTERLRCTWRNGRRSNEVGI